MHVKSKEETVATINRPLCICDSTLGAGEQAPGTVFSGIEKYRIAQLLDGAGVPQIEVGNPMLSDEDRSAVRHIARMGLSASVMSSNRAEVDDINASIECDVDAVSIEIETSSLQMANILEEDHEWVLNKIYEATKYASDHGLYIACVARDAARADLGFLVEFAKTVRDAGADRIGYCDSVGVEDPSACGERIKIIKQIGGMDVEVIPRDDFGLATANVLSAARAGARFARVTSMGIGQRAGCASLEQAVMVAKHVLEVDTGIDPAKLRGVAEAVSAASGVGICPRAPVVGANCFAQEAGLASNPAVTEPYDAAEVGAERTLVIGRHTVRNTVVAAMAAMGVQVGKEEAESLLSLVRRASAQMHRSLTHEELFMLYEDMMCGNDVFDDSE